MLTHENRLPLTRKLSASMKSTSNPIARIARAGLALAAATLLGACGGGEQVERFHPGRIIAFGDEFSVINSDQTKYSVNGVQAGTNTVDCTVNPLWIQVVGNAYGFVFQQCNPNAVDTSSHNWSTYGATVADLGSQIDQQLNSDGLRSNDLVTVLIGANDVIAQFQLYPAVGEDQLTANLAAAGMALAQQVNRLTTYGAKVLVVTIPNMGLTPFGGDRSAASTDSSPALLNRLSVKFNDALLSNIINDGHKIGLIQLDEYLQSVDTATRTGTGNPVYGNTTLVACAVPLPRCTTNTLVAEAENANWLWADNRHFGAGGQSALGSLALSRAQNNPF